MQYINLEHLAQLLSKRLGLPWFEIAGEIWNFGRKVLQGMTIGDGKIVSYEIASSEKGGIAGILAQLGIQTLA